LAIPEGYHEFVSWEPLDDAEETKVFERFWSFFQGVRTTALEAGATFAGYCFWAQAEDTAMDRAIRTRPDLQAEVAAFRAFRGTQWVDLHDVAKAQIQTEGAFGLKTLAVFAGFQWRDENPSGEASMSWYDEAVGHDRALADAQRRRLLAYNEDDCRATAALRDWLNGPARDLRHRDDLDGPWHSPR
jgi:predicted RecB family nuclease